MKATTKTTAAILSLGLALLPAGMLRAQDTPPAPAAEKPGSDAAPAAPAPAITGASVLLTVDGTPILVEDVQEMMISRFGRQLQQMPQEQRAMVQQQMQQMILSDLISKTLLLNAANKKGFEASDEAVKEQLDQLSERIPEGSTLEEFAASSGVDINRIKKQVAEDVKIRQLIDEVTAEIEKPGDEAVKKFYDENPDQFKQQESATASHILISTRDITDEKELEAKKTAAEAIQKQAVEAKDGEFATLAQEHSDCPSKAQGGSLGTFGKGQMVPEFETAVFSQEIGKVGGLVKTQFGYHIIKVTERQEAKTLSYDEVKEELATNLFEQSKGEKVQAFIGDLRKEADIQQTPPPAGLQQPGPAPAAPAAPAPAGDAPTEF